MGTGAVAFVDNLGRGPRIGSEPPGAQTLGRLRHSHVKNAEETAYMYVQQRTPKPISNFGERNKSPFQMHVHRLWGSVSSL